MALMNAAIYHPYTKPPRRPMTAVHSRSSAPKKDNVRRGDQMGEVLVDGVVFVFDASGTKLVKKSSLASRNEHQDAESQKAKRMNEPAEMQLFASSSPQSNTPLHASVNGTKYIRTKNGNLINQELVTARRLARNRIQTRTQDQAARNVVQQENSQYPNAALCQPFSRLGWCEEGAACRSRHARECPDFAARGTCPNKHCRLAHLGKNLPSSVETPKDAPDSLSGRSDSVPETDMLFVRDDIAAKLDPAPESMLTEGPGSVLFAGQNDFISLDGEHDQDDHLEDPIHANQTAGDHQSLDEHLQETQSVSSASVSDDSMEYDSSDLDVSESGFDQDQDSEAVTSDKEVDQALGGL
ncbi:hypothetical protein MYAM1_003240 [Malassezia yamatoensis]|uniref:C3H1-type domain-containing protein n=1 Tax=Malassezia yamatoensis TaxID=253288 RepID=A0AAJ5YVY9_9BASI|nr:hypothetical protein MYAM1_003240 [Malassezia yamatoensis]